MEEYIMVAEVSPATPNLKQSQSKTHKKDKSKNVSSENESLGQKAVYFCKYCHKPGHKISTCRKKRRKERYVKEQELAQKEKSDKNFKSFITREMNEMKQHIQTMMIKKNEPKEEIKVHSYVQEIRKEIKVENEKLKDNLKEMLTEFQRMIRELHGVKQRDENIIVTRIHEAIQTGLNSVKSCIMLTQKQNKQQNMIDNEVVKNEIKNDEKIAPKVKQMNVEKILGKYKKPKESEIKALENITVELKMPKQIKLTKHELNEVRPFQDESSEEENYPYIDRSDDEDEDLKQIDYEQELQYTKPWYVKKGVKNFGRKDVKVLEKDLDDKKFKLQKFWKNEETYKQPLTKMALKTNYRLLTEIERTQIQKRDDRKKLYSVKLKKQS